MVPEKLNMRANKTSRIRPTWALCLPHRGGGAGLWYWKPFGVCVCKDVR